jgi:hypothetical protein
MAGAREHGAGRLDSMGQWVSRAEEMANVCVVVRINEEPLARRSLSWHVAVHELVCFARR